MQIAFYVTPQKSFKSHHTPQYVYNIKIDMNSSLLFKKSGHVYNRGRAGSQTVYDPASATSELCDWSRVQLIVQHDIFDE